MLASAYAIEVAGRTFDAQVSLAPMYDPASERAKV